MSLADFVYAVIAGSRRRRAILTPVGLLVATGMILLVILGGRYLDTALGLPRLLPAGLGLVIGIPLLVAGVGLHLWCVVLFRKAGGTPVPFDPPRGIVTQGPYAWTRNPMLTGLFAWLFGVGFILDSVSIVFVCTPLFIVANLIEVKLVEEPELEKRLGASYREYKRRVPMFLPRPPGARGRHASE